MALRAEIAGGDPGPWEDLFFKWLVGRRLVQPKTAVDYLRHIRRVLRYSGIEAHELRHWHLEGFLEDLRFSPPTKEISVIAARMVHRWGADRGMWRPDPDLLDIRIRKRRRKPRRGLTLEEATLLLRCAWRPSQARCALLGLFQGLRLQEMVDINARCWVRSVTGRDQLLILDTKFGKDRTIPVHPIVQRNKVLILETVRTRKTYQRGMRDLREAVGRPDLCVQLLRATFAQTLTAMGVQRQVTGELLGHEQTDVTTTNYAPVTMLEMETDLFPLCYS